MSITQNINYPNLPKLIIKSQTSVPYRFCDVARQRADQLFLPTIKPPVPNNFGGYRRRLYFSPICRLKKGQPPVQFLFRGILRQRTDQFIINLQKSQPPVHFIKPWCILSQRADL